MRDISGFDVIAYLRFHGTYIRMEMKGERKRDRDQTGFKISV